MFVRVFTNIFVPPRPGNISCSVCGCQLEGQLHGLQQTAGQAAEYVKRLEQTNYALSVRVQAMGNSGPSDFMGGQRPPDVF